MRLNKKGYLVVELIVSFVIAMTMAFFLMSLVTKVMAKNDDELKEMKLLTDKTIITNSIMKDLKNYNVKGVSCNGNTVTIITSSENKTLVINDHTLNYDGNLYTKTLDKSLTVSEFKCNYISNGVIIFNSMTTIYDDTDYGLNLIIRYSN